MRILIAGPQKTRTITLSQKEICPIGNCGRYEKCSEERDGRTDTFKCDLGEVPIIGMTFQPPDEEYAEKRP